MFLEMLNDEQKELFMHLAVKAAEANNEVADLEVDMLRQFAAEMRIDLITSSDMDLSEIVDKLKDVCGYTERKIILFELVGIMFSDKIYDEKEREFLGSIANSFEIKEDSLKQMVLLVERYIVLYNDIFDTVIRE